MPLLCKNGLSFWLIMMPSSWSAFITVSVKFLCEQPLPCSERIGRIDDDQIIRITFGADKSQAVFMKDVDPLVCQTVGDLRDIFPADLHEQGIRLHHVDHLDGVILDQVPARHRRRLRPQRAPVSHPDVLPSHMGDHLMVDKFIPLRQHQISVHYQDLSEIFRLKDIDPLHLHSAH